MYIYDGSKYTEEEIQNAADKAGLSLEEYTSKNNITFEEEVTEVTEVKAEKVDFPTSTVEDADAVQQPMTALQAEYVEPEDTELAPVDTSLDSQSNEPFVVNDEVVTQKEFERAASFDEDILAARTKLKEISLSAEEINAIEVDSNRPPVKIYEGTGPGGVIKETYVYDDFIKEAKKEIATETKVDIYNIPEEDWRKRAKSLYVKSREKSLFNDKKEVILEDYEETVYGTNPFSFARIKKLANKLPSTNLTPTKEDIKYAAGRGILTESFDADQKKASENYKKTISSISNYETLLNAGSVEINALLKKQADTPGDITKDDVARGKVLAQNQKLAYELYAGEFDKLAEFEGEAETAAGLADVTKRTYNNLDVVNNRMVSAGSRMMAGLGSVAKELSISQIVKRTTGADIRDADGRLPVYLRNIAAVDAYDRVFGSEKFEETVSNLYTLTDKIDQGTKAKQELGEIKGIEDFGEFMLDLFSEQAVNTVTTVGLGGAGLVAVSAAAGGNKFNEMDMEVANDPTRKISAAQFYASGILFGGAEYLTETVSLGQARGALNYLGFGKKNFGKAFNISGKYSAEVISKSKTLQNTFKNWGVNMAKEGGAEFSAQLLNNLTDINILNKEDINWSDGLSEAFITGSLMSGLGFNAPALVGGIANTFRTTSEADLYNKKGKEILEIRKAISTIQNNTGVADQSSSQEAISALQLQLDGLVEQNVLGIGTAAARVEELSQNDKRQLLDLDTKIQAFKVAVDAINNNVKLSEQQKKGLIASKITVIDNALKNKNRILAASQNSQAKQNQKKIQIQLAAEEGLNFDIVNAKNPEEAIKQANLIINTAASDGKITPEQKSGLKETLKELQEEVDSKTKATDINGQYFGAEFGLPIALSLEENLIENEMGATVLHETGHATVFKSLIEGGGDILGIVSDMEAYIGKRFKGAKAKFDVVNQIADRDGTSDIIRAEEKMTAMLEYVSQVELSKDMTFQGKLLNKWNKIAPKGGSKEITSIKTGADVFALINSFARSFDKGELSGLALKVAKGEVKAREKTEKQKAEEVKDEGSKKTFSKQLTPEQDTQLRSDVAEIKKEASESEALAKKFNKDFIKGAKQTRLENKVLNEIKPVVERVITNRTKALYDPIVEDAKKLVSREMFQESMRSDIETMVLNEFTGKQDIEKFIVNRGFLRANNLAERLGIKNAEEGIDKNLDTAKTILVEETEQPKTDRPRYRNILKSNVLPTETTAKVKDKVLKTVRTLKSKLNTKISINKTVTPLIAEIKENMGKQADIDFKKAMGGKKDGQLKRFLIKNKKAILENMTTTWLVKAMPGAIQKQVDGNFTSDWQGKKIDREKTTTQQAGRTSGAEIVRRLPNAFKNLDDKTYLGYVVDESGAPIRGRKESLAKAMAEELSFDIFAAEIQDENSEISKAFEGNQEALGVILADNFVNEVIKDADRGTVKFSISPKSKSNIKELLENENKNLNETSIEYALNTNLLSKLDEIKTTEDLLKTLYSETIDTYGITNMANRARIKILNLIARNDNNTISFEEIFNTFQKAVTRELWKYEKQVIGFEYSLVNLKNNIEKDRVKAIKNWFKYDSRVIRTQKIQGITRNLDAFNYLKSKEIVLDGFKVTFNDDKTRSYIEYNGERLFNLTDVTDIKKNFELKADLIDKEASDSIDYMLDTIEEGVKNNDIGAVNGWIALMYEDQRGPIRKSSKVGKFVKNYKELKLADLILEHETEAYYIYKAYQDLANNYSNAKVKETKNFLEKAFVNLVSKEIDADLKLAKQKGFNNKYRYRKSDKKYNLVKFSKSKEIIDPKGKVYKSDVKFSKTMNSTFNKMLERKTGIAADETLSRTIANRRGIKKGKYKFFMPSSLDDFKGLTSYTFAGKGKQGEADQKFFQDTLIDPYFKGIRAIEETRQAFKDDFRALNKQMKPVIKKLGKLVPGTEFTHDQAIRVALWNASGYEIPGISEIDQKKLVDYVNDNADLSEYARKLQQISKRPKWAKPGDFWDAETILSDLNNLTEKVGRKEFLSEFIENADIIFSKENLNKVQAGYGKATRDALEDILYRMKNGTNRPSSTTDNTNTWNTWVNNSIGAIMFFNRRSALLQTLSTINFINWSDNNPLKAATAFANQKQYWSDFAMLFNSSKLKQRRSGLKSDVNEAEIAKAVKGSKNKAVAALSYLLKIGFTPTQMADSFAIAAGGATFYRNRVKSYLKKVNKEGDALYTKEKAEEMAFKDFSQISEETQQSGDPALISSDQASTAGRLILSFQNTPIQLNRSIKKAALDIKNRRRTPGQTMLQSDFSNFSKIIYYGTVQNIIFSALQNALFALIPGFEDEDDELTEKEQLEKYGEIYSTKQSRIVNGMIDTTLKGGFGFPGAIISTVKNAYLEYDKQEKKKFMADHTYTILALFNLAPSVGSKGRKVYSAIQTKRFEKDVIEKRDWDITIDGKFNLSPSYKVLGGVVEGFTNLPLDRAVTEVNALTEALDYRNTVWQRVALALGWRTWDVGAENEEHELIKTEAKAKRKEEGKIKAKETRAKNKKIKKLQNERRDKAFNTLSSAQRKETYKMNTAESNAYLDKIAKQKGIK